MIDGVKGLYDENPVVRFASAALLIATACFFLYRWHVAAVEESYSEGYAEGYAESRFDIPEDWLPAFSGFSSETGERHFFLCDVGMRSLTELSMTRMATVGPENMWVRINPLAADEQKAVQARLERACAILDRHRR